MGKLYISYPMVESLKHLNSQVEFKHTVIDATESKAYKSTVDTQASKTYMDITRYSRETWNYLIVTHIKKMHYITRGDFSLLNIITPQEQVLESQIRFIQKLAN